MIGKGGRLDKYTSRALAHTLHKVIENLIMDDSLHNVVARADLWQVKEDIKNILHEYQKLFEDEKRY